MTRRSRSNHDADPRDPTPPEDLPSDRLGKVVGRSMTRAVGRFTAAVGAGHPILLEYAPPDVSSARFGRTRPPHSRLQQMLLGKSDRFLEVIRIIERYGPALAAISRRGTDPFEPHWDQIWFTGVDAAALYAFIRERKPRRYHEIGSGNSTLFARRAIQDEQLQTYVLSVDPAPQAEVDAICDEVVRAKLQDADIERITSLDEGDILLVDSSHYAFMNSDVTAFFLDVLPAIPDGVLVGIHDIFLPEDYPWWLSDRWYAEQYLLAAWLLADPEGADIRFATHFAVTEPRLRQATEQAWDRAGLGGILAYGTSFWFQTGAGGS